MTTLISTINEIVKYGLQPNLSVVNKEKLLEQHLVKIYALYFDVEFEFDATAYPDFDKSKMPNIIENVQSNFSDYGWYQTVLDINDLNNLKNNGVGDAIDDLSDIIIDLLEVKWRIENNSLADGLFFFQLMFYRHMQQHMLDLLNYMKQRSD